MYRPVKVNLNENALKNLKEISEKFDVSESEVLRWGLAVMQLFNEASKDSDKPQITLTKGEQGNPVILRNAS